MKQACSVRDVFDELQEEKVTIFGLSSDKVETQLKFVEKHKLPYDLISDQDGEIAKIMGIPVKMKKFMARQAFLFKNKKLVWKDEKASPKKQGSDALKIIRAN